MTPTTPLHQRRSDPVPDPAPDPAPDAGPQGVPQRLNTALARLPYDPIALLARVAIAGVFWRSGQTKVEGFALDLVEGQLQLGWPRVSETAVALFRDEYRLPLLSPQWGATLAALGEHVLPALLLVGLATRLSAAGLLVMTLVIQLLVYPGAWPTHATWAALLLVLMRGGAGRWSLDALWSKRQRSAV